ncbi:MAG: SusC/RagA family protein, partial [Muribaculaceae bacterium]|nr:SusC/RagA family protein [Muribaculaceae bacterium]
LNSDKVRGFDTQVKWNDRVADFSYSGGGNLSLAIDYKCEQYMPQFENSRNYYVYNGHHRYANQSWGLTCIGQFGSWEEIASYPVDIDGKGNSTMRPGDLIYKDMNGDGVITNEDQSPIGVLGYEDSRTPIINFNLNLSASWRGFDLAADFTGAAHITYIQNYETRHPFWGDGNTFQSIMGDQWHLSDPTDINSELIPGRYPSFIAGNNNHINYAFSTFWMQDIWYVKLRNLTVGYTLPTKITKKAAISNLRFYASFQNLFSIDNVRTHTDPEIAQVSGFAYPTTRVYSIGVNLTF